MSLHELADLFARRALDEMASGAPRPVTKAVLAGMRAALERAKKKLAQPVPVQIVMDRLLDELEEK